MTDLPAWKSASYCLVLFLLSGGERIHLAWVCVLPFLLFPEKGERYGQKGDED